MLSLGCANATDREFFCEACVEKIIKPAGQSTALPGPSALHSCGKGERSTWDHRKAKAAMPPLPVEKILMIGHPQFPQQWVHFSLKQDVNVLSLIFISSVNSGIVSLTLNSEGRYMLSNQALASIKWITNINYYFQWFWYQTHNGRFFYPPLYCFMCVS